jgi:hypothetical protein
MAFSLNLSFYHGSSHSTQGLRIVTEIRIYVVRLCYVIPVNNKKFTSCLKYMVRTQRLTNHVSEHRSFVTRTACIRRQLRVFFSPAINLPYFLGESQRADFQHLRRPHTFGKYFSTHNSFCPEILAVSIQILSFSFCSECGLSHKLSHSLSPPCNNHMDSDLEI